MTAFPVPIGPKRHYRMGLIHAEDHFTLGAYVDGYRTLAIEWERAGSSRVRVQDCLPLALTTEGV
ncbi:MAG: hypothetical protein AB1664_17600 [Thermodesulfobacteriota bacterium]